MGKLIRTSKGATVAWDPNAARSGPSKRHRLWIIVAAGVIAGGTVGAIFTAGSVASNEANKSRQAFRGSSSEIASTLQLAIQHEEDLVVSAGAFIAGNDDTSTKQFAQWVSMERAVQRYPEMRAMGLVTIVPAAGLAAWAQSRQTGPLSTDQPFVLEPQGNRPYYCFSQAVGYLASGIPSAPPGYDYCAGSSGPKFLSIRDSGRAEYLPLKFGTSPILLLVETPVYRDGVLPTTLEARRQGFLGIIATMVQPGTVLDAALRGHPRTAVTFAYHQGSSKAVFRSGASPRGSEVVTISLHNGWTVSTFGLVSRGGVLANKSALMLLLAGIVMSLLFGALVFVLGTGRARALQLVGLRTSELRHQALHDGLTGLPNRALIMDRIEQLLVRSRRHGTVGAALFLDLDEFKNVNDTLGHAAGDRLLVAVAARLESTLRDADTIGRMGGDEFVVLIDGGSLPIAPELVAERLLDVMRQPFELEGAALPIIINVSIGIATGDRAIPGDLLRDADVALYQAKDAGKNRYEIFQPEMQTQISYRTELEFALRSALEREQFRLVYQPIYNLDDLTLVGVEALLRWEHPTQGLMLPDAFIPILEQTGQIREVGSWVLHEACLQMAAWHSRGDTLDISVNVSGRQLDGDEIVESVRDALRVSGLDATSLIIEVTETTLMRNANAAARRLQAIKALGVKIAVDDFGTGYSSLAYLRQFPVDCIKIDRSFTNAIATSPESRALIGTLVQLGRDLGLRTLAEGVETTDEIDVLRAERVNEVQGFLLAHPVDAEVLEAQLLRPTRRPALSAQRQSAGSSQSPPKLPSDG
jgi:diguanylate cyclase (GGDEF)-like protein